MTDLLNDANTQQNTVFNGVNGAAKTAPALVKSARREIGLLVDKTHNSIINSPRLLPLITRLTSAITVRILSATYQRPMNLLMLADHSGYLRCINSHCYQGQVNLKNAGSKVLRVQQRGTHL